MDIRGDNVNELLPERLNFKSMEGRLNFDIINFFIKRSTEYFKDIKDIYEDFPFDLMIADCAFSAIPFVKEKMNIPVVAVGIFPLAESSKDLTPYGLAITPSKSFAGRIKQAALRWVADKILFAKSTKAFTYIADLPGHIHMTLLLMKLIFPNRRTSTGKQQCRINGLF